MSGEREVIDELMGMLSRNEFVHEYERDVSIPDSREMLVHHVATNRVVFRSRAPCLADWVRWGGDTVELLRTTACVIQYPVGSCRMVPSSARANSPEPTDDFGGFKATVSEAAMLMQREHETRMGVAINTATMRVLGQPWSVVYEPKSVQSPEADPKPPKLVPSTYGWRPEGDNWVPRHDLEGVEAALNAANIALAGIKRQRDQADLRANRIADECGALRAERDELLKENATLRRTVERLERKTGKTK